MATLNLEAVSRIQRAFVAGLAEDTASYARACQVLNAQAGELQLGSAAVGGLANEITTGTSSVSAANMATKTSTISEEHYAIKHTVPAYKLISSDFALDQAGQKLANAAVQNINKQFFDGLEGLFAAGSHPAKGTGVGETGANAAFIDSALKYLQTEAGEATQANLSTAAFSEAALDAAIQLMQNYRDQRGLPLNLGMSGSLALVVGPKNRKTAMEVVGSQLSGADMQINTMRGLVNEVISFPLTTDEDDWFLIDTAQSPCGIWIKTAPVVEVRPSDDGLFVHMVAKWTSAFYKKPYEYGIVGSNVA
jgi:hypothetical protein